MTESEWLTLTDPTPMLAFLRDKISDRKMVLFYCECCRRIWDLLEGYPGARAVEAAEGWADDTLTGTELVDALSSAIDGSRSLKGSRSEANMAAVRTASFFMTDITDPSPVWIHAAAASGEPLIELKEQTLLVDDIFGNPFRPVTAEPSWLSSTVTALANAIYAEKAFDRLPILADALEEAGCDNADVLSHCRGDGPHVRGCWVVDLVLGKT